MHFLHVRSAEPGALPLIITHGWPGSVVEFMKIIGPLTDPARHGGDPADAFHVVAPSLPGFGFSSPLAGPGWDTRRVARAWAELMHRLGYHRYGAQGGDTGSVVSPELGRIDPDHVIGVHVNNLGTFPSGDPAELAGLTEADQARLALLATWGRDMTGYAIVQSTRPQTLSYALTDSPVGQLAWIVEKFKEWTDPTASLPEDAVDRDLILTDVSVYWLTGTAGSAARIYYEGARTWGQARPTVPGADRGGGVPQRPHHPAARRTRPQRGALGRVQPRRALRRHGSTRPPGRRRAGVLPPVPLTPGTQPGRRAKASIRSCANMTASSPGSIVSGTSKIAQ